MAAPSHAATTAGATDATGDWISPSFSGSGGQVFILHVFQDGPTADAIALNPVAGTQTGPLAGGTTGDYDFVGRFDVGTGPSGYHYIWMGRCYATDSLGGTNSTSEDIYMRVSRFNDVRTVAQGGVSVATVIENGSAGGTATSVGDSATAADAAVVTLGADRLALNFVAVNDDNPIPAFTGESGGDWTLAAASYAESSGTDGAIGLQVATMASEGTIDGGTASITDSDAWGTVGFALIGTTVAAAAEPRGAWQAAQIYDPALAQAILRNRGR